MTPKDALCFFEKLGTGGIVPKTELLYANHFELLIAVMLSAQATDKSVNLATPQLFATYPSAFEMAEADWQDIKELIRKIGLANTKAKNILKTSQILVQEYQGQVPETRKELEALPGVGRKTANVLLNVAFGHPTIAVDTHVFRVSNRTGLATGKTPLDVENKLLKVVPDSWKQDAHHLLILHGRYTCRASRPKCADCVVSEECAYSEKLL